MKAKLNLPPLIFTPPPVQTQPTADLASRQPELARQMKQLPSPLLRPDGNPPGYQGMQQVGFITQEHAGFLLHAGGNDFFIHAKRREGGNQGEFQGDKLHLSIAPDRLAAGFELLAPMLFSEDSPIDKWKITDLAKAPMESRVAKGAQLTLYIKPAQEDGAYQADELNKIRHLVENIEQTLSRHAIPVGERPDSDIAPHHWQFTSYRNEFHSDREENAAQSGLLHEEPIYQLLTE
ncbi:27.5 kDa virulence protein [Aeromonas salmonicida]|jgi:phosphothreonine lyase|uniref:type III effector phosphothreonine lyase n=1 Tax=Aeromonas salmonicida TaxID=645 RepID=UPI0010261446|nr:type III effector phosphothreonine lyase [Aeromonas salmonicida]MDF8329030.1 type III effector phosphothreonine lyase [Aeromonas salmonicida]VFB11192.1 27.5 kDa virulence protein [Aeromonas salmonicida]